MPSSCRLGCVNKMCLLDAIEIVLDSTTVTSCDDDVFLVLKGYYR